MSEPLAASLERLRKARTDQPDLEELSLPPVESPWVAAAQGRQPNLEELPTGKPRFALGARAGLAGALALLALGGGVMSAHLLAARAAPIPLVSSQVIAVNAKAGAESMGAELFAEPLVVNTEVVIVHVAGAVAQPGIVELPLGSRVAQAVELAGGAVAGAELDAINLARVVVDGEQILVPLMGQAFETPVESVVVTPQLDLSQVRDAAGLINLNQAGPGLLQELPGIGPALSGRIIEYRENVGGFSSVAQLQEVSGIGPAVMNDVRDKVTV